MHVAYRQRAVVEVSLTSSTSVRSQVNSQYASGVDVRRIYASLLHFDPDTFVTRKDIANSKDAERRHVAATLTTTDRTVASSSIFLQGRVPSESKAYSAFVLGPSSNHQEHFDVFVLDCTYKTNKYDFPLLNIATLTAISTILPVARCWLPGETEEHYTWGFQHAAAAHDRS